MKKLLMLIVTLSLIWIASSAQGIQDSTKKKIELPEKVAKENVKDLLRGDSAIFELQLIKQNLEFTQKVSSIKDSIINNLNQQIGTYKLKEENWNKIISEKDFQFQLEQDVAKKLSKDLKREKRKNLTNKIFGGTIILGLTYLYITK